MEQSKKSHIQITVVVNSRSEFGMSSCVPLSQSLNQGRGGFKSLYDGFHLTSALYCAGLFHSSTPSYRGAGGSQRCEQRCSSLSRRPAPLRRTHWCLKVEERVARARKVA